MNKEFVPYDIALAMKDIGFDEECFGCYTKDKELSLDYSDNKGDGHYFQDCSTPLYQQAFRWFRENYSKHNVPLGTLRLADEKVIFHINGPRNPLAFEKVYDTYEEAQIACLKMLIDSVIKQKEQ